MSELKVGLIGAGGIARAHLPGWKALGADVVIYSEQGTEALIDECQYGTAVDSLAELLESCDIIDIVTPTHTHAELATIALKAGKDVVCEKPLALSAADAQQVVDLAQQLGRHLYPAHVVRYFPEYVAMRQAVRAGAIGQVAIARFSRVGSFPDWAEWFADDELSGGVIMDLMIHDLDVARWVNGRVSEVYATIKRVTSQSGDDIATAQVVLTHANDAISYVRGVWGAPGSEFWSSFHVSGNAGVLHYDSRVKQAATFELVGVQQGEDMLPDSAAVASPYWLELQEFTGAIGGGQPPRVSAEDGIAAVVLAQAAIESARTGKPVRFETGEGL